MLHYNDWVCLSVVARRIGETYDAVITLDPKPIAGDWNGTGAHTNFSTKTMREDGGIEVGTRARAVWHSE